MIWVSYVLLIAGYSYNRGFFTLPGILLLCISFLLLTYILVFQKKILQLDNWINPEIVLVISAVLSLLLYGGLYQQNMYLVVGSYFILAFNLFMIVFSLGKNKGIIGKNVFLIIFVLSIAVRFFMILSSPNPQIDVFDYLKHGPLALSNGQNPYSVTYHKIYTDMVPDYYNYLPSALFITFPFVVLLGDPRFLIMTAEIVAAFFLYKMFSRANGRLFALLILSNPMSLYVLEQSYIQPLVFCELVIFAYFMSRKRILMSSFILGIILSTKQYILLLPLYIIAYIKSSKTKLILIFIAASISLVIILPFLFWDPKSFIHDTFTIQTGLLPRYEGLTITSLLYNLFGIQYNFFISTIIIFVFFVLSFFIKTPNILYNIFIGLTYFLFAFFLFNKFSFVNYYYLVSQLLVLSIAFIKRDKKDIS